MTDTLRVLKDIRITLYFILFVASVIAGMLWEKL